MLHPDELLGGLPGSAALLELHGCIAGLSFSDKPDYARLAALVKAALADAAATKRLYVTDFGWYLPVSEEEKGALVLVETCECACAMMTSAAPRFLWPPSPSLRRSSRNWPLHWLSLMLHKKTARSTARLREKRRLLLHSLLTGTHFLRGSWQRPALQCSELRHRVRERETQAL
jgi:hypothetical protein